MLTRSSFPRHYLLLVALLIPLVIGMMIEPGAAFLIVIVFVPFTIITFLAQDQQIRDTEVCVSRYLQAKEKLERIRCSARRA